MRQRDLELLETHLSPLRLAKDRQEADLHAVARRLGEAETQIKDLKRDKEAHSTSIAQGLASVRSMLQRANKAARAVEEEEEEIEVDTGPAPVNVRPTRDDVIRHARARHGGRLL